MKRRTFIADVTRTGLLAAAMGPALDSFAGPSAGMRYFIGFDQAPLPYAFDALEPNIDARTMEIHYTRHAAAYSTNLKDAAKAEGVAASTPLETLLAGISRYSAKMRNNGGGHYNHELFWKCMQPNGGGQPSGALLSAINSTFGSFEAFRTRFSDAAKSRFGSGWAWLYLDGQKKLNIGSTPNQDNPLMDISEIRGIPVLGLDVWEHAYYLKYQNKRADYVDAWWKPVNLAYVQSLYQKAIQ
jgi:Fe-Mn family superoxide dismutase